MTKGAAKNDVVVDARLDDTDDTDDELRSRRSHSPRRRRFGHRGGGYGRNGRSRYDYD